MKLPQIFQKILSEQSSGTEICHILLIKMQIFNILNHLLQPSTNGISIVVRIVSVEGIENNGFVCLFLFKIPLHHSY